MTGLIYNREQFTEYNRLVKFIRDHISEHGGLGYDYYVGIAQNQENYETRIKRHESEGYEIIDGTLAVIESDFNRVVKDVEYYFTKGAETKNLKEWTLGKYGGCKYPHRMYIFKTRTMKLKQMYMQALVELG